VCGNLRADPKVVRSDKGALHDVQGFRLDPDAHPSGSLSEFVTRSCARGSPMTMTPLAKLLSSLDAMLDTDDAPAVAEANVEIW
jgi:hypothetical protein